MEQTAPKLSFNPLLVSYLPYFFNVSFRGHAGGVCQNGPADHNFGTGPVQGLTGRVIAKLAPPAADGPAAMRPL